MLASAPFDVAAIGDGLWANGRDSISHALDHFSERSRERADRQHHDKWIVLSVHHAAECVCNMRLLELEPKFFLQKGAIWFPSLTSTLKQLESPSVAARLSPAERQLFTLMAGLADTRHKFVHRTAPEQVDVSIAAMCMIGLLKYMERLTGETASEIVWQSPPIEGDVVSAIRYTRLEEYGKFVALFLSEKYPGRRLRQCPSCSVEAVVACSCEACFEELGRVSCADCEEDIYFMEWERTQGGLSVECEHCGLKQAL